MSHVLKDHPTFEDIMKSNPDPSTIKSHYSSKILTVFSWLDWVNGDGLSFNFVEKPLTREYTKLPTISVETLMKYIGELTQELEAKISSILPEKFALVFDGWTLDGTSTHYMAVFATFLVFIVLLPSTNKWSFNCIYSSFRLIIRINGAGSKIYFLPFLLCSMRAIILRRLIRISWSTCLEMYTGRALTMLCALLETT